MSSTTSVFSNLFSILDMLFYSDIPISFVRAIIGLLFYLPAKIHRGRASSIIMICLGKVLGFCNYSCAFIGHSSTFSFICMWELYTSFYPPSHPQMIQLWDGKNRCSISIATSVYIHCLFEKRHSKSLENSKDIQNYRFSHIKNCSRLFPSCLLLFALRWKWRMFKNQHTAKNKPTELIWIDLYPHLYWLNFHQSYIFNYSRIYKFWK